MYGKTPCKKVKPSSQKVKPSSTWVRPLKWYVYNITEESHIWFIGRCVPPQLKFCRFTVPVEILIFRTHGWRCIQDEDTDYATARGPRHHGGGHHHLFGGILGSMTDSLCMEKHQVKSWPPRPKSWPPPQPGSDPPNDTYITLLEKVTFDSLVDVYPPQLKFCPYLSRKPKPT